MAKKKANEETFRKSLQTSFRDNLEQSKLKLALLKENFKYQKFFSRFLECDKKRNEDNPVWHGFGFNKFGLTGIRFYISHPSYGTVIDLINPQKDSNTIPEKFIDAILPRLFYESAVELIELEGTNCFLSEGGTIRPIWSIYERGLKPWERIYKVNLSKKKTQIMKEFEGYLDRAYLRNAEESDWTPYKKRNIDDVDLTRIKSLLLKEYKEYLEKAFSKNAEKSDWAPNNKRDRKEAWGHLAVWKLRKKRKSFSEISRELHITIDAAKKSFYRSYELTQCKRYDPEALRKEVWPVEKTGIKQPCDVCPKRKGCRDLCPDVLRYVDQDEIHLREKLLEPRSSEDSDSDYDSYRDHLIQKDFKRT